MFKRDILPLQLIDCFFFVSECLRIPFLIAVNSNLGYKLYASPGMSKLCAAAGLVGLILDFMKFCHEDG